MERYLLPTGTAADVRPGAVAVLPVGSHEQHGPCLPLATDTVIACTLTALVAEAYGVRPLPPVAVSCSHEHADWPGTVSISATTLAAVVKDIAASLGEGTRLVLLNAHGGNYVLGNVVQESRGRMALFPGPGDWARAVTAAGLTGDADSDMHAGEIETSILLHAHPGLVRDGYRDADHEAADRAHLLTLGLRPYAPSGVVGRPSLASAAKGEALLASLVASFGEYLSVLQSQGGTPGRP